MSILTGMVSIMDCIFMVTIILKTKKTNYDHRG